MYPAHIRETGERQTVREHCRNTAVLAASALRPLGLEKSAYLAGLLHDAGKNKQEYAQYLSEAVSGGNAVRGSVNHTFAGVRFLLDRWHCREGELSYSDVTAELLAFAVGSHHGLFDCVDPQQHSGFFHRQTKEGIFYDESRQGFLAQVAAEEELEHLFRDAVREMIPMLDRLAALSTQADDNEADRETAFYIGLLARMLLSAVIEGDRTDTAAFMDGIEPPVFPEDMRPIWTERLAFMEKKLAAFPRKSPIDLARHTISDTCAAGAVRPGGVYRLNVPTGGGKTLASLRFALTHAAKWNCSRIIFTAPLLSILDQNAQVIRDYIEDDALILEHHSNLAEPKETPERLQELELLTASWSAPIIITTLVQLLNTCFSGKTSAIRRFHALCGSVIVIDEVQTVPGKMLTLFNLAVNFLSEVCGATIVLCSATQPCLEAADHPLRRQPVDLVPQQKALWDVFKRTDIQNAGCAKLEELPLIVMGALSSCDSLLVVCNTKKEAAFLFESLQAANCRCFHLSAAMCVQHRRETLQALQSALDKPSADRQRVVCISTQVIEAGVDISFQRVIRFSAGMDSVVQAAGRCNRHAEQKEPAPRPPHPVYRRAAAWSGRHRARTERHHRAADRLFQNAGGFPARSVLRGGHPVLLSPAIRRAGARLPGRPNPGARLPLSSAGGQPPVCRRQLRAGGALPSAAGVPSGRRPFSGIRRGHERPARTLRKRARAAKHAAKRRSGLRAEGLGGHSRLH